MWNTSSGGEQMVELRTVNAKRRLQVEQVLEHALHLADGLANGDFAAQGTAQVRRGGQVVGVGVGFQQPLHLQAMGLDERHDVVGLARVGASGRGVVVEHRVDNGTGSTVRFIDDVGPGRRGLVQEGLNQRRHDGCP